jgi:hypothetical protein
MSREIPQAVRAVAGLAATMLDETRRLPQTLTSLPVRVLGLAMQATMKLQQHYSGLVARGDEVFTGIRGEDEPGLATFDEDLPAATSGNGVHSSAFDRAAEAVPDEEIAEEVAQLIDDEVSGLPQDPAPEEVVEALQDITDEVAAAGLDLAEPGLTTEDALESALLEADGAPDSALVDGGLADGGDIDGGIVDTDLIAESPTDLTAPITEDAAGGPAIDAAPAEDLTADVATDVDVLTLDGEVETVEATVTDEGIAAPEGDAALAATTPEAPAPAADAAFESGDVVTAEGARVDEAIGAGDGETAAAAPAEESVATDEATATDETATDEAVATDEGGTTVAAATGHRTDVGGPDTGADDAAIAEGAAVDAVGDTGAAPTDDAGGGSELAGSQAVGSAPIQGYDGFSIAQLRGRLRGYQLATVQDLLAYEEATRAREPYLRMLRNRLEKVEQQAVEASPLAPRGA